MKKTLIVSAAFFISTIARADNDEVKKVLAIQQSQLTELKSLIPKGSIFPFAGDKAPQGWAVCDGSLLSTAQFSELFAVIGYRYGGNGTKFALPDLRDEFIRGASSSRKVGTREEFATAKGNLSAETKMTTSPAINTSGQYQSGWPTGHFTKDQPYGTMIGEGGWGYRVLVGQSAPNEGEPFYFTVTSTGSAVGGSWTTDIKSPDTETRPRNVAMNYIIKL
jgi:hypothetical protein